MKKTVDSGTTVFSDIFTDDLGMVWNILRRGDGSISIYATKAGYSAHYVVFDSLDKKPMSLEAKNVLSRFEHIADFSVLVTEAKTFASMKW